MAFDLFFQAEACMALWSTKYCEFCTFKGSFSRLKDPHSRRTTWSESVKWGWENLLNHNQPAFKMAALWFPLKVTKWNLRSTSSYVRIWFDQWRQSLKIQIFCFCYSCSYIFLNKILNLLKWFSRLYVMWHLASERIISGKCWSISRCLVKVYVHFLHSCNGQSPAVHYTDASMRARCVCSLYGWNEVAG